MCLRPLRSRLVLEVDNISYQVIGVRVGNYQIGHLLVACAKEHFQGKSSGGRHIGDVDKARGGPVMQRFIGPMAGGAKGLRRLTTYQGIACKRLPEG